MDNNNDKKMSLIGAMRKYYVDGDGKPIIEAVDLGQLCLRLVDGMHKAKEIAAEDAPNQGAALDDLFMTLVYEVGDENAYHATSSKIRMQLAIWKGVSERLGNHLSDLLLNVYLPILGNKFYQHDGAHYMIQFALAETVKRQVLAYFFAGKQDEMGDDISAANLQCSVPVLDWIAFLCSVNYGAQIKMAVVEQEFMYGALP